MTELKAMALVGVAMVLSFSIVSVALLMLGAGGEALAIVMGFVAAVGSVAMARVTKRYEALDRRREREAKLRLR